MIGTTGALIIALLYLVAGCVIGLLISGLVLRKHLTLLRGLGATLLSGAAFVSMIVWLNCNSYQDGACVDNAYSSFHNQLVIQPVLSAAVVACVIALLLSICLRALDRTHKSTQGEQNV